MVICGRHVWRSTFTCCPFASCTPGCSAVNGETELPSRELELRLGDQTLRNARNARPDGNDGADGGRPRRPATWHNCFWGAVRVERASTFASAVPTSDFLTAPIPWSPPIFLLATPLHISCVAEAVPVSIGTNRMPVAPRPPDGVAVCALVLLAVACATAAPSRGAHRHCRTRRACQLRTGAAPLLLSFWARSRLVSHRAARPPEWCLRRRLHLGFRRCQRVVCGHLAATLLDLLTCALPRGYAETSQVIA